MLHAKEMIQGEQFITDAPAFAELMMAEANRIWTSDSWKLESKAHGVIVESKPVAGPFEHTGIFVMRSAGIVNADPQETFNYLVSPEGYAILDPVSNPEDHQHPPLEKYSWRVGCRLEAAVSTAKIPFLPRREFVVLNAIIPDERIFVSKSILHPKRPGASKFYCMDAQHQDPGFSSIRRAVNTMALKCEKVSNGTTKLLCINYADMGIGSAPWIYNFINRRFFAPIYKRLEQKLKQ